MREAVALCSGLLSRIIPRTNRIWVFGGNKGLRFADNSMYFFKHCHQETDKRVVWLTQSNAILQQVREEGFTAHKSNSLQGWYYGLRAKWHIFDVSIGDTSVFSSKGAKHLNLWHGYPLKDIRCLKPKERKTENMLRRVLMWLYNRPNDNSHFYVLHTNKKYMWQITESFDVKDDHVIVADYPRNVVFKESPDSSRHIATNAKPWIEKLEQLRTDGKRVLGYFPTWRSGDADEFMGTRDIEQIRDLNEFLHEHGLVVVTKWHTCVFSAYAHHGSSTSAESLNETMHALSNIVVLDFEQDLNSLLGTCDVLISDYSSVIIDFLQCNRPQIFMAYDLQEYEIEWGFMFNYNEFVPGPIVSSLSELKSTLGDYAHQPETFSGKYKTQIANLRKELFETELGSCEIVRSLESQS